jgi:hypothetical protein
VALAAALLVGVGVTVTLNTVGMTVLTGMELRPLEIVIWIVSKLVVRESETEGAGVGGEEGGSDTLVLFCAETG